MVEKTILKQIGLTDNEITVYLSLLQLGESLASRIGEKLGMNRSHTYDILESLINKGLVSYVIKNNRKYFNATHPNKLSSYLNEKEELIKEQNKKIKKLIPQLLSLQKIQKEKSKVEIYHGKEGIKSIYNDILRKAEEYYVLGATGKISEILLYYFPNHERQRIKNKIRLRLLFNEALKGKNISANRKLAEIKFLPKEYSSPIPMTIYNNRIIILVWTEPMGILIEDKEVADTFKQYFKLLWKLAKK